MPASRIDSVDLNEDGSVTIKGTFVDMKGRKVTLLHIWLAQQGGRGQAGVGLAVDCLDTKNTKDALGAKAMKDTDSEGCAPFEVKDFGAYEKPGYTAGESAAAEALDPPDSARFRPGPATVSAIAVISPVNSSGGDAIVLQWGRMLTLPGYGKKELAENIP